MKTNYIPKRFAASSHKVIAAANEIIADYNDQGYSLTLRQLYYRLVASDQIENTAASYDRVGAILNDARLAGLVDWSAIEDRTRNLAGVYHVDDVPDAIADAHRTYRIDKWIDQPTRPEIWVEKEALAGIVGRVANRCDVGFVSCRGYMSQSEMHAAAMRFLRRANVGQKTVIIHLGDHDPSGVDMTRDIDGRTRLFMEHHAPGSAAFVDRIALNMPQIRQYDPPPNPAKLTDSRYHAYAALHGESSWELDALEPRVLDALIEAAIWENCDREMYSDAHRLEQRQRAQLATLSANWGDIAAELDDDELTDALNRKIEDSEQSDK